jgi:uncharacterized protein (TIGR02271 family)
MTTGRESIVIGIFNDYASADRAMAALRQAGISNEQIRHTPPEGSERESNKGIKGLFTGGKTGAHKDDAMRDLIDMGVNPEEARIYQREYEAGHPLVSVEGRGDMQDVVELLASQGAHGPGERAGQSAYYAPSDVSSTGAAASRVTGGPSKEQEESQKIRLHAERLRASKQPETTGEVNVRKEVVTEQQTLEVPVTREEVVVERRSLAEDAAEAEATPIGEGETLRIPVREERVNVTKEPVTTGEVEISKREYQEKRQFSDTVRHEEARIEKEGDIPIVDRNMEQPPDQPQI